MDADDVAFQYIEDVQNVLGYGLTTFSSNLQDF